MKTLKIFYNLFIAIIVTIAVLLMISVMPITGSYKILVVKSGSMEPTIKTGSIVVVKPAASYQVGDIVTFSQGNKSKAPITHRIVEIKVERGRQTFITQGDTNKAQDDRLIAADDIIGKVLFSLPYVGYAVETARQPYGFILIIVIPAAIIIYDEIKKIIDHVKELKNKSRTF